MGRSPGSLSMQVQLVACNAVCSITCIDYLQLKTLWMRIRKLIRWYRVFSKLSLIQAAKICLCREEPTWLPCQLKSRCSDHAAQSGLFAFFLYTSVKLPECLLSYRMDMLAISEAGFISGLVRKRENHGCFVKMPSRRKSNDESRVKQHTI
jgi:hypothetical protein